MKNYFFFAVRNFFLTLNKKKIPLPFNASMYLQIKDSGRGFFMLLRRANAIKVWANAIIFRKQRNYCCCLSIFSLNNV